MQLNLKLGHFLHNIRSLSFRTGICSSYLVSISSTFCVWIFRTTIVSAAFSSYVLALSKNSYEKCVHMTLMKLTGVNFINILCSPFLYKSASRSFSLVMFWLWQKYSKCFHTINVFVKCWWNWQLADICSYKLLFYLLRISVRITLPF